MTVTDLFVVEEIVNQAMGDPRPVFVNPLNIITSYFIPAALSFGVVVGFSDFRSGDTLRISIRNMDSSEIGSTPLLTIGSDLVGNIDKPEDRFGFVTSQLKNIIVEDKRQIRVAVMINGIEATHRDYKVVSKK